MNETKTEGLVPKAAFDGWWWEVPAEVRVKCPECEATPPDRPNVMRYVGKRDFLTEAHRIEPLWPERGWRVWWACRVCGWEWHKGHDDNYATTEDIETWIRDFRKWYRSLKWKARR